MSCGLVVKPLRPSASRAFLGLKSTKTRRSFLSAPRRLSIFWVTFWVRILRGGTSKISTCRQSRSPRATKVDRGSKKDAARRHTIHLSIRSRFHSVADKRQWSSTASLPRRKRWPSLSPSSAPHPPGTPKPGTHLPLRG